MQKKISIFSFFSGIGILDLAFEKNGYNIVFVNEYDNLFIESYRYARMQMNLRAPIYIVGDSRQPPHMDTTKYTSTLIKKGVYQ